MADRDSQSVVSAVLSVALWFGLALTSAITLAYLAAAMAGQSVHDDVAEIVLGDE